jgi:light-regulated signal transduction histidine kinase (bacteriophytochrome)
LRGWLAVPLKAPDGRNLGLIQLSDKYDGEFTEADEAIMVQLAEMGSAAVEARRLTESLGKSNEQLARTNRELEEFAYVASHDLQEPLRMVNVYTQQLLRRFVPDHPDAYLFAKFIEQGVHRMQALIEDLLDFSRTVHASGAPAEAVADLGQSLNEAMTVLRNRIEESKAVIETEPLPTVFGDTNQLAHVFQNLLSNALKYRRQDVAPHIRISTTRSEKEWIISVSDNGIGFDPQYSERIFGLFKRLHKEAYPGTGLGLAICRRIIERYGGRMWAEGRPGHGATFHFALHPAVRTLDHVLPPGTQTSNTR